MAVNLQIPNLSVFLLSILVFGVLKANALDIDLDEIKNKIPDEITSGNLTDRAKVLFKDKCSKVAGNETGSEAFNNVVQGIPMALECLQTIVNVTAIQAEIDKVRPYGELDTVFNKYCKKRPDALSCVRTFIQKADPCLEEEEKENTSVMMRIFESLLNFVCHKGGDQIALFIAERGPECLDSKKEGIQRCMNESFWDYLPDEDMKNFETLPKFIIGAKQCEDIKKLNNCINTELETCDDITPANIVESMFRFIKNETICRNDLSTAQQISSDGQSIFSSLLMTIFGSVVLFLLSFITHQRA